MPLVVNYQALGTAANDIQVGGQNMQNTLETMDAELRPLTSSADWEGSAQEAYKIYKQQWTEGMQGMRDILTQVATMVLEASDAFNSTDRRNADRFM